MSLNTAHANDNGVLIHSGEQIILYSDDVTMEFSGQHQPEFKGTKSGRIYLTTHRMIFNNKKKHDSLQSFSFPFIVMTDVGLEQPVFGANYIRGVVTAQPNGNWAGQAKFKLVFKSGGAIDFGQAMLKAASFAKRNAPYGPPPPYVVPEGPFHPAPPPAYHPEPNGYYGWVPPTRAFPHTPPPNTVFMTSAPPPYVGIYGPPSDPYAGASGPPPPDPKAAEAAQSAYYDPNKPQFAYVPPPAYYEHPPSYQQAMSKKEN
ncbi:hypothetical protein RUM43_000757 [Polyplax serrata]|uniref:GRAM domain-containing protein n=1 Tax=Polyplax serrata TaxID=468196 RepID=A0AAN8SCY6_POLSC